MTEVYKLLEIPKVPPEMWAALNNKSDRKESMKNKKTMQESLELIKKLLESEEIKKFLPEVQDSYIDWKLILDMWKESATDRDKLKHKKRLCVCVHWYWEHGEDTICRHRDCPCREFTHDTEHL